MPQELLAIAQTTPGADVSYVFALPGAVADGLKRLDFALVFCQLRFFRCENGKRHSQGQAEQEGERAPEGASAKRWSVTILLGQAVCSGKIPGEFLNESIKAWAFLSPEQ